MNNPEAEFLAAGRASLAKIADEFAAREASREPEQTEHRRREAAAAAELAADEHAAKTTWSITQARARLGFLVRRTARTRERITIIDSGQPAAVLINPRELADLEDALALARYQARKTSGALPGVPHKQARARLGLERN